MDNVISLEETPEQVFSRQGFNQDLRQENDNPEQFGPDGNWPNFMTASEAIKELKELFEIHCLEWDRSLDATVDNIERLEHSIASIPEDHQDGTGEVDESAYVAECRAQINRLETKVFLMEDTCWVSTNGEARVYYGSPASMRMIKDKIALFKKAESRWIASYEEALADGHSQQDAEEWSFDAVYNH